MRKTLAATSLLVFLVVACTGSKTPRSIPSVVSPTLSPSPTATSPSQRPSPTLIVTKRADGWKRFTSKEVGVSFWFPPLAGPLEYAFEPCRPRTKDCPGAYYSWLINRTDAADRGHSYWFAGFTGWEDVGREGWPTDVRDWGKDSRGYWVSAGETLRDRSHVFGVEELKTHDGSRALVFKPGGYSSEGCGELDCPNQKDRAVIITFTRSHGGFLSLAFYFLDRTPLADIEEVVHSVRFSS
jgi:hypothetical protein